MGVNRFIDYANPMYWAKMLKKKGGGPTKYSFKVIVNPFTTGEGENLNTVKVEFGNGQVLNGPGEIIINDVYDSRRETPGLEITMESVFTTEIDETSGKTIYGGYGLLGSTKCKITLKDGRVIENTISPMGSQALFGLFHNAVTRQGAQSTNLNKILNIKNDEDPGLFTSKFDLTNNFDASLFDGWTFEFTPVFETIKHNPLLALGQGTIEQEGIYPILSFSNLPEASGTLVETYCMQAEETEPSNRYTLNIALNNITKLSGDNPIYFVTLDDAVGKGLNYKAEGEGRYSATILFGGNDTADLDKGETKIDEAISEDVLMAITVSFEIKEDSYATFDAAVMASQEQLGTVQINDGEIGTSITGYGLEGNSMKFRTNAVDGYAFEGWYKNNEGTLGELVSRDNPYEYTVKQEDLGNTTKLLTNIVMQTPNFFVKSKNYYGNTITVEKKTPAGSWETLAMYVHEYSGLLKNGDIIKCTMTEPDGFEDFKWHVGNQVIQGLETGEITLDDTNREITYEMTLSDGYGVVFLENYPDKLKNKGVKLSVYKTECNLSAEFPPEEDRYTDMKRAQSADWTQIFVDEQEWQTVAFNMDNKKWWIKVIATPNTSEAGAEIAPYITDWNDAVDNQSWGGGYSRIYHKYISPNDRIVKLSCMLASQEDKNKYYKLTLKTNVPNDDNSTMLLHQESKTYIWLSMIEHNPSEINSIRNHIIRFREIPETIQKTVEGVTTTYKFNGTATVTGVDADCYALGADIKDSGYISFNNKFAALTEFKDITLTFNYDQQQMTEEEFLKSNIAEAKEKLADAIEALEKDYDDGKEDVVEETPVKDEPDTDEADVAEAVLATEPTEDKE